MKISGLAAIAVVAPVALASAGESYFPGRTPTAIVSAGIMGSDGRPTAECLSRSGAAQVSLNVSPSDLARHAGFAGSADPAPSSFKQPSLPTAALHDDTCTSLGCSGYAAPTSGRGVSRAGIIVSLAGLAAEQCHAAGGLSSALRSSRTLLGARGDKDDKDDSGVARNEFESLVTALSGAGVGSHGAVARSWVDPATGAVVRLGVGEAMPAAATVADQVAASWKGSAVISVSADGAMAEIAAGNALSFEDDVSSRFDRRRVISWNGARGVTEGSGAMGALDMSEASIADAVCAALDGASAGAGAGSANAVVCARGANAGRCPVSAGSADDGSVAFVVGGSCVRMGGRGDRAGTAVLAEAAIVAETARALSAPGAENALASLASDRNPDLVAITLASPRMMLDADPSRFDAALAVVDAVVSGFAVPRMASVAYGGRARIQVLATGAGTDRCSDAAAASEIIARTRGIWPQSRETLPAVYARPRSAFACTEDLACDEQVVGSYASDLRAQMSFLAAGGNNGTGNGTGNGTSNDNPLEDSEIAMFQLGLWTFVLLFVSMLSGVCIMFSIDNSDPLLNPPKSKLD